jgi:hypothetical protein
MAAEGLWRLVSCTRLQLPLYAAGGGPARPRQQGGGHLRTLLVASALKKRIRRGASDGGAGGLFTLPAAYAAMVQEAPYRKSRVSSIFVYRFPMAH